MPKGPLVATAAALAMVCGTLTACTHTSDEPICRRSATGTQVPDRYCERKSPGYEWWGGA
ncbi:hypothetical protein [Thermomonospora catenispora]|uniref:hypothetical protein n=1 Tax=Thermomonospora catenispora TaxID=2493090 RepID=UPI0011202E48|nr:hypothetical protein [Thermomonospora catenispora]TNY35093.1 hypothetical protein EIO00_20175 [Thermomonospora catenispora]